MKLGPDRIAALVILMMVGGIAVLIIIASGPLLGGTSGTGPINEVKVIVSYDGSWSGLISNSTMSSRHNGTGTQAFIFTRSDNASMIVSAFIERTDNGTGILTVSLETSDGTVLQAMSVGTPKGIASINWEG